MNETRPEIREGKVVSAYRNQITWVSVEGDDWQHILTTDAQITLNGKLSKLDDLKVGMPVRVTVCADDDSKTSCISAQKIEMIPYT